MVVRASAAAALRGGIERADCRPSHATMLVDETHQPLHFA
jgi:hypothetical protein